MKKNKKQKPKSNRWFGPTEKSLATELSLVKARLADKEEFERLYYLAEEDKTVLAHRLDSVLSSDPQKELAKTEEALDSAYSLLSSIFVGLIGLFPEGMGFGEWVQFYIAEPDKMEHSLKNAISSLRERVAQ